MIKTKTALLILALLLVGVICFATPGKEKTGAVVPAGTPQYGGTLTFYSRGSAEPADPDEDDSNWISIFWLMPMQETLMQGGVEEFGIRGGGTYPFQSSGYLPYQYIVGRLIESWTINQKSLDLKVREGIHWAADNVDWMDNRELVAADIVDDMNSFMNAPWGNRFDGLVKSVEETGKYTLRVNYEKEFSLEAFYYFGWEDRSLVAPPEMRAQDDSLWINQIGTGPFLFEEYVPGSHMSYTKNPNYWGKTTVNGVEYQMPFIDRYVQPIIPDEATQMAALRTGRIDLHQFVPPAYWDSLDKSTPDLQKAKYSNAEMLLTFLLSERGSPQWKDPNVRRAMMIGTDIKAHQRLMFSQDLPSHSYPIHYQNPGYMPLEDLPPKLQELYDYNPQKAKQMLADAGYPDGFEMDLYVDSSVAHQDNAALLQDEWSKIGVKVNIVVHDPVSHTDFTYKSNFKDACFHGEEITNPINSCYRFSHTNGYNNFGKYHNAEYDSVVEQLQATLDSEKQIPLMHQATIIALTDLPHIPLYPTINGHYWWPWIGNYYGEVTTTDGGISSIVHYCYLDKDLKKSMGY